MSLFLQLFNVSRSANYHMILKQFTKFSKKDLVEFNFGRFISISSLKIDLVKLFDIYLSANCKDAKA
jgi:hypothetical protein